MPDSSGSNGSTNAEKRRRTASSSVDHASSASGIARPAASGVDRQPQTAEEAAESRFFRHRPSYAEQAVEIFFRDFPQEDYDFALKVAEKALTDENKAMVFCKMPPPLRIHWIKRLREAHNRSI